MSQSLVLGSFCKPHAHPEVPGEIQRQSADEKISIETLKEIQKETFEDSKILKLLTDMRFRNMMLDSGTPFLRSKEIA